VAERQMAEVCIPPPTPPPDVARCSIFRSHVPSADTLSPDP
jgi:hypothetical protein